MIKVDAGGKKLTMTHLVRIALIAAPLLVLTPAGGSPLSPQTTAPPVKSDAPRLAPSEPTADEPQRMTRRMRRRVRGYWTGTRFC